MFEFSLLPSCQMELRALSDKILADFEAALVVPGLSQNWVNQIRSSAQITFSLLSLTAAVVNILKTVVNGKKHFLQCFMKMDCCQKYAN